MLMPSKSSPGSAFGQAVLSRQGSGELLDSAKVLPDIFVHLPGCWSRGTIFVVEGFWDVGRQEVVWEWEDR